MQKARKASKADILCWDAIKRNHEGDLRIAIEMGADLKEMDADKLTPIQVLVDK